jgi:hypothetical protein
MKIHKNALLLFGAGLVLIARLAVVNSLEISLPLSPNPTPYASVFDADQTVIPAGGCITLSWAVPNATRVILRGSNWPQGTQDGVAQSGSSTVCPSAAAHYVPNEPVHYTLMVSYGDGHTDTHEIVVSYQGVSDFQPVPSATFDPNATPAGIPVTPDADVPAVFQQFENGWMVWRGDKSTIFVLVGDGTLFAYSSDAAQPSPLYEPIPPGRFEPDQFLAGVWRSWMSKSLVSSLIGWPTAPSQTYNARVFGQITYGFGMTLPDGRYLGLNFAGPWYLSGITGGNWTVSGAPVTFMSPSYPTPTLTPIPTLTLLGAIYQPFEHGFMVWREDQNCVYTYIDTANPGDPDGNILIPHAIRALPDVSSSYHYCVEVAALPENTLANSAPPGLFYPTDALARVWGYYADVREGLGYAVAPQQHYVTTVPPLPDGMDTNGGPFSIPQLRLPDGRSLWCGFRAATSGTCSLQSA